MRFTTIRVITLVAFLIVLARLFYWQIIRSPELQAAGLAQYQRTSQLTVSRGGIYTADGYPLVINQKVYTLFAQPKKLTDPPLQIAATITPYLFPVLDAATVSTEAARPDPTQLRSQLLTKLSDTSKGWVALMHDVPVTAHDQITNLNFTGIGFDPDEMRYYPEGSMAAQLLGFVGNDAQGNPQGYFGIEGKYDLELKGKVGSLSQETDALGKPIAIGGFQKFDALSARDIHLTIKRDIQNLVEQKIAEGVAKYGAKSADAVIMEPSTGKILAMASYPSYDPARFVAYPPSLYKNPLVADSYEPGSTFKVLTVASGIDAGVITPETQCDDCGAPKTIGKYTIKTWNDKYFKNITMLDALAKSDNTAMMFVAARLGKERFVSYIHNFGMGEKTGIDLQDETTPSLRDDNKWGDIDVATASFGQGIAVTGIQILDAVASVANHGMLMRPYVVDKVVADQQVYTTQPKPVRQVMKDSTAAQVTQMMIYSAGHGDAKWALPKGYTIAGKTGTAQIPINGHYDENRTIASFIGFAPAEDPKFAMLVRVSEPTVSEWGSETAAPIWFSIAKDLFVKMGIPPNQ